MTRTAVCVLATMLLLGVNSVSAQPANGFYVGGGLHYAIENFDIDDPDGMIDFDNSWGMNLKAGYFLHKNIALEGLFQYHFGFSWGESWRGEGVENGHHWSGRADLDVDVSAFDLTLNLRAVLPLERFRPYAVAGAGFIRGKIEMKTGLEVAVDDVIIEQFSAKASDTETEFMARFGVGCDILLGDNWGINGEFAYNMPFGDLDDMRFYTLGLGVLYRF